MESFTSYHYSLMQNLSWYHLRLSADQNRWTHDQMNDVNTTDVLDAIQIGCHTMSSVFNAYDDDVPFFGSTVWPEARLTFSPADTESHVHRGVT